MDVWHQWSRLYLCQLGLSASSGTVRLRRHYLNLLAARHAHPGAVTEDDLVAFLSATHWSAETRKSARSTVRGFYKWCVRTGRLERDPSVWLPPVRVPSRVPRPVPEDTFGRALVGADERLALMLLLAGRMGLRRAEIARVHTGDLCPTGVLVVHGKGGRERAVPVHPDLAGLLEGAPPGWLFPGRDHGHVSPDWVGRLLSRALGAGWSGHGLRKRFATRAAGTGNLWAVKTLLGHARLDTTCTYVGVSIDQLEAAVRAA